MSDTGIIAKALLADKAKAINHLKDQIAGNVVEIGRHLSEAREMCEHGEWSKWVESECDFKDSQARQYIRIFQRFGNTQIGTRIPISKLKLLAQLPDDTDQKDFVEQNDVENKTVRELKAIIHSATVSDAEKAQIKILAEREAESKFKSQLDTLNARIGELSKRNEQYDMEIRDKAEELSRANRELKDSREIKRIKDDLEKLKQLRSNFQAELSEARELGRMKAEVDELLKKLAPARYMKFTEANDEALLEAIKRVVRPVEKWVAEMNGIINRSKRHG